MHISFLFISQPFSIFPHREMTCFAVVWTTRDLDAEFIYLFSTDLPLVPAKLISRIVCSLFASPTNRNNGEIIRLLIEYLIRGDPYIVFILKKIQDCNNRLQILSNLL